MLWFQGGGYPPLPAQPMPAAQVYPADIRRVRTTLVRKGDPDDRSRDGHPSLIHNYMRDIV
jgi:hypothetical protein